MPIVDMPLVKLKEYMGSSPCPDDFDEYWKRALDEMNATDPQVELIPAEFTSDFADCFDLYFTGVGGARVYAKYLRPKKTEGKHPAILQFHGYSGDGGNWFDKLPYVQMGYSIASMDCRGQGGKSEDVGGVKGTTLRGHIIRGLDDHPDKLLFRNIFLDTAMLAKIVMGFEDVDPARIGVHGGSQGGGLTVACACLVPEIKKIAPCYPFLSDYLRVWNQDWDQKAYEELRMFFRRHDPLHKNEQEYFRRLGYIDISNMTKWIKAEVQWAIGMMDDVCPPSTQFAAYNKITSPKKMLIYPDFGHEGLPRLPDLEYEFFKSL